MLSREFLIERGYCCGLGCRMCPYEPKHIKGNTKMKNEFNSKSIYPSDTILYDIIGDDTTIYEPLFARFPNSKSTKHYQDNPIEYKFNNNGFRTPDDFNSEDEGNIFLGCSHTLGQSHHLENTWSYKLSKEIGGKFWNLSQGGGGIQTDFRLLYHYIKELKVNNVFHYYCCRSRFEYITKDGLIQLNPWSIHEKEEYQGLFYTDILSDDNSVYLHHLAYFNAIQGLLEKFGVNYYLITKGLFGENDNNYKRRETRNDGTLTARDGIDGTNGHYTVGMQDKIYKEFYNKFKRKDYTTISDNIDINLTGGLHA